ncbi:MAG TPA: ATP-binding protein [Candidatus Kapabacteria bacterium]|nr:ATP-binding protein [Candidatus Kapabacteria bacterium]
MSISRSYEGMGVGLAVTKQILYKLSGELSVQSDLGKGTTVIFCINNIKANTDIFQELTS